MKVLGIIPARYASSRFPGKPLADIRGKSMIQRVYEQARKAESLNQVVVATDHDQIFNHVSRFGGQVCMTGKHHKSGTDRCFEALTQLKEKFDYVINIQGDEPFIQPEQINALASALDGQTEIATLVKVIEERDQLFNPNVVKAVADVHGRALYFSRSPIPYARNIPHDEWIDAHKYHKHIGMYGYRVDVLERITGLEPTALELTESLEQLRWLENGMTIRVIETIYDSIGIDSPEDLARAVEKQGKV